jgi:hypothetical protein
MRFWEKKNEVLGKKNNKKILEIERIHNFLFDLIFLSFQISSEKFHSKKI